MSELIGKKVLITGGASGIGRIMGRIVLEKGAELIIWDINEKNLKQTENEFLHIGRVHTFVVDISDLSQIKACAQEVLDTFGTVDILINNAGIVIGGYFHEQKTEEITRTMNINANAPMFITSYFLPTMLDQRSGHICNIASSAGLISNPKMAVYAASKWSVIGWSDSLRLEMRQLKSNVHVTTIMPYYINTGMFDGVKSIIPLLKPESVARKIIRGIEKNRIVVSMPWSMRFVRFCQGFIPIRLFDFIAGDILGIYKTMATFTGRKN